MGDSVPLKQYGDSVPLKQDGRFRIINARLLLIEIESKEIKVRVSELEKRQRVTSDEILNNDTDTNPLDETAYRHGEANPDEANETLEPTTENISPNVSETRPRTRARRNLLRDQKKTDTTPLDETASKHSEANPDQADEIPEPTTKIILPNVSFSNLSCLRPSLPL
ncbi:hypothetical protein DY000_02025013 [Brassica cretica]|uniref:Uncharacterized protein n=1 Tax=Brassica cretica TaxID=69181 RepID=A0ABQ7EDY8_BRACR|nr:hypothetical protein DY000_02025013 [Brassica cretica]